MLTSLALATAATAATSVAHPGGPGFGFLFFVIPLFWVLLVVGLVAIFGRRRRAAWAASGYGGPWGGGWAGHGGPWAQAHAARSAETTLAERFAQGDIDEKEYRARLEVLRASAPQPPMPPVK